MIDQILRSVVDHWQPILLRAARTHTTPYGDCSTSININTPEVIHTYICIKPYLFHVNRLNMLFKPVRSFDFGIDCEKVKRAEAIALLVVFSHSQCICVCAFMCVMIWFDKVEWAINGWLQSESESEMGTFYRNPDSRHTHTHAHNNTLQSPL